MVKNRIKIYARLKKETKPCPSIDYTVNKTGDNEILAIFNKDSQKSNRCSHKFNFDKVFDTTSKQNELFDGIAQPIINGVLNGFNGTIFAYGPTGSGKTYSLTGSHTKFNNRGLIPRSIEYIFNYITKSFDSYVISISYLEIYNEIAYDLLNSKENVSTLEELPRVLLLEDNKGEAHYKNLSVVRVCSEEEAMRLLFLGDTNRTIAETPLNDYSSRSHCIFTLHITARIQRTGKIIKSKLNLVDLAGSERVHKMNLNGISLSEAKYINLSLHYLEQVILAISETKRMHIPFRNSMMTFVLRDSISGNCLTAMLATLAMTKYNFEETIATCKFSQRVSLVKTDVQINEETDPHVEIEMLRNEVIRLRQMLEGSEDKHLETKEVAECQNTINSYLYSAKEEELSLNDSKKVKLYIDFLKRQVAKSSSKNIVKSQSLSEIEKKYKDIIKQKDEEISILKNIFDNKIQEQVTTPITSNQQLMEVAEREKKAYERFLTKPEYKITLDFYSSAFDKKHYMAAEISKQIEDEQQKIKDILASIEENRGSFEVLQQLSYRLKSEQNVYRELLLKLQNIKSEIEYLKNGAKQFEMKLVDDFKNCMYLKNGNDRVYKSFIEDKSPSESSILSREHRRHFVMRKSKSEKFDIRAKLDELLNRMEVRSDEGDDLLPQKDINTKTIKLNNNKCMYGNDFKGSVNNTRDASLDKIVDFKNVPHSVDVNNFTEIFKYDKNRGCKEDFAIGRNNDTFLDNITGIDLKNNTILFNNKVNPITELFNEKYFSNADETTKKLELHNETSYFETSNKLEDNLNFYIEESLNVAEIKSHDFVKPFISGNPICKIESLINSSKIKLNNDPSKSTSNTPVITANPEENVYLHRKPNSLNHRSFKSCYDFDKKFTISNSLDADIGNNSNSNSDQQFNYKEDGISRPISADGKHFEKPVRENRTLLKQDDCQEFLDFMKTVPMTGDADVDEEIVKFYRMKFKN